MMGTNPIAHENREDVPMKLLRTASHLALTSAILSGLAIAAPAAAQDAAPMADEAEDGGEIVVTARRREESILETPLAITAVTSADLEKKGFSSQ